jgi:hypothetical protein
VSEDPAVEDEPGEDPQAERSLVVALAAHRAEVVHDLVPGRVDPPGGVRHVPGELDRRVPAGGEAPVDQDEPAGLEADVLVAQVAVDERRPLRFERHGQRRGIVGESDDGGSDLGLDHLDERFPRRLELFRQEIEARPLPLGDPRARQAESVGERAEMRDRPLPVRLPQRTGRPQDEATLLAGEPRAITDEPARDVARDQPPALPVGLHSDDRGVDDVGHAGEDAVQKEQRLPTWIAGVAPDPATPRLDLLYDQCPPVVEPHALDRSPGPPGGGDHLAVNDAAEAGERTSERFARLVLVPPAPGLRRVDPVGRDPSVADVEVVALANSRAVGGDPLQPEGGALGVGADRPFDDNARLRERRRQLGDDGGRRSRSHAPPGSDASSAASGA